ncbi:PPE domain-containing protein [Mycobacterium shigaense]|uniref:ESX-1 secretion-associated protein EspB n=1 Tax=Mycobacterium shigaense TaxID=722731 RepID=A0A1Z4EPW2_9MYCO|nr:hypothetical protein [Mycobacterium shigaense]MEA1121531.1 hypothetical protein [Mycobacterium shigaense]PRI15184.1 hypothetical protein B2J96_12250 [Mycobacterium shigaense]BAX95055.1 ESX-1 secretion-associated protein EspB [Mycobacterium shigaense]
MTQSLNVEYQELMARADEIDAPLPKLPVGNPQAPCSLAFVRDAAVQIAINADSLRLYIQACQREWSALAKSLRTAAKAYEEVDEGAADDINAVAMDGRSSAPNGTVAAVGEDQMSLMCDPDDIPPPLPPPPPPPPFEYPYYEVRQAARDIETPDQGAAFRACAADWNKYQLEFQQLAYRFRPFLNWEGDARAAVESNFNSQKQWIYGMVTLCTTLAKQAQMVADAHKKVAAISYDGQGHPYPVFDNRSTGDQHPTAYEVSQCDYWYKYYVQNKSPYLYMALDWYKNLQTRSETALSTYISSAGIPLAPLNPTAPYGAYIYTEPGAADDPGNIDIPDTYDPSSNMPMTPALPMMPSAGMGGGGTPAAPDAQAMVNDAMKKAGLGGKGAGAVKPASLGGGGGVPGIPGMPLQGAGEGGDAASRPAAAAPGAATAGLGKGLPGAGAGGGMGGGMPMGGAQGKQDGGKGKRVQAADGDESLYTEERAWTEGVIGNRPRKGPGEKQ